MNPSIKPVSSNLLSLSKALEAMDEPTITLDGKLVSKIPAKKAKCADAASDGGSTKATSVSGASMKSIPSSTASGKASVATPEPKAVPATTKATPTPKAAPKASATGAASPAVVPKIGTAAAEVNMPK